MTILQLGKLHKSIFLMENTCAIKNVTNNWDLPSGENIEGSNE